MKEQNLVLIEDDSEIRELIGILLEDAAFNLTMYSTATGLLNHLEIAAPDMIVMDISLPDGNGMEICKQLKENVATRHIPVILMSANSYENIHDAHPDAFIAKPFDIKEFLRIIESKMQLPNN